MMRMVLMMRRIICWMRRIVALLFGLKVEEGRVKSMELLAATYLLTVKFYFAAIVLCKV